VCGGTVQAGCAGGRNLPQGRTIRIEPPLGIADELLKEMLNRLEDTFKEISGGPADRRTGGP